jgi:hypothetical protein
MPGSVLLRTSPRGGTGGSVNVLHPEHCLACRRQGLVGRIEISLGQPTLIVGERFVDEQARVHHHDEVTVVTYLACSHGHQWLEYHGPPCWCGWTPAALRLAPASDQQVMQGASLTRTAAQWEAIAAWCLGPGAATCHSEGAGIAQVLRMCGPSHPARPLALADLSAVQIARILAAERLVTWHQGR